MLRIGWGGLGVGLVEPGLGLLEHRLSLAGGPRLGLAGPGPKAWGGQLGRVESMRWMMVVICGLRLI